MRGFFVELEAIRCSAQVKRKRREAYAEAAGLMTTRAVKTLTKMRAKNVVEEMRAGLTPISFFIKKPGPPPEVRSCVASNTSRRVRTPARWRGGAGSSPLDRASTAASSPRLTG